MQVFEKIIEKLEEQIKEYDERIERRKGACHFDETENMRKLDDRAKGIEQAIEIVKQAAAEYEVCAKNAHTGWIPCSERLPEDGQIIIVTDESGKADVGEYDADGKFCVNESYFPPAFHFIAWQPLPEPYQPNICDASDCPFNEGKECPAAEGCAGYEPKGE